MCSLTTAEVATATDMLTLSVAAAVECTSGATTYHSTTNYVMGEYPLHGGPFLACVPFVNPT